MPQVTVDGLDDPINLPDGLSQDEMTEAIESHPAYKAYKNSQSMGGQAENFATGAARAAGSAVSHMPFVNEAGQKLLGAKIEDSPEIQQWQKDHPVLDTISDVAGKTAAYVPATLAAEATGAGTAATGGIYGLYNMAGKLANKGKDFGWQDVWDATKETGEGMGLAKLLGKISPTFGKTKPEPTAPKDVPPAQVPQATPTNITTPLTEQLGPRSGLSSKEASIYGIKNSAEVDTPEQSLERFRAGASAGKSMAQIFAEKEAAREASSATAALQAKHAQEVAAIRQQNTEALATANANNNNRMSGAGKWVGGALGAGASHLLGGGFIGDAIGGTLGYNLEPMLEKAATKIGSKLYNNQFLHRIPQAGPILKSLAQAAAVKGNESGSMQGVMKALGMQ